MIMTKEQFAILRAEKAAPMDWDKVNAGLGLQ